MIDRCDLWNQLLANKDDSLDIVVVGGGSVGLGIAVDATNRGYRVACFEQADFGQGTSSRSTKLIHGGVRYLRQGNISLVREALRERGILLKNAPDLVHPMRFAIPNERWMHRYYFGAGMKIYDWLAGRLNIKRSSHLSLSAFETSLPSVSNERIRGATTYHDAQFDDTRLLIALAKCAVSQGGVVLNYCKVTSFHKGDDRIKGVEIVDQQSGASEFIRAKVVVNATGIFSDQVRRLEDAEAPRQITCSQGIHLSLPGTFWRSSDALMIPKTQDGRVLFAIPWMNYLIVGTTDTPRPAPELEPVPIEVEIDYLLEHINEYLTKSISRNDVTSVFAGLRPLVRPVRDNQATSKVSREHSIVTSKSGLISVLGGKWTTYRKMAEDAVEEAIRVGNLPHHPCSTQNLRLDESDEFVKSTESRMHDELPYSRAQFKDAIAAESVCRLDDVLARRTRCLFLNAKATCEIAPEVAKMLAEQLGETSSWQHESLQSFYQLASQYHVGDASLTK